MNSPIYTTLTFLHFVQNKRTKSQGCCYWEKCKLVNNLGINQIKGQLDEDDNPQDTKPIQTPNVNYYEDETNQNQAASN